MISRRLAWVAWASIPPIVLALLFWIGAYELREQRASGTAAKEASFGLRVMIWDTLVRSLRPYVWRDRVWGRSSRASPSPPAWFSEALGPGAQ